MKHSLGNAVFKCALMVAALGLLGFIGACAFNQMGLKFLAEQIVRFSAALFLASFIFLLITGALWLIRLLLRQLSQFFSPQARQERKASFYLNKLAQQRLIFEFKKAKILYLAQQKRKRLFKKWSSQLQQ